jgi:hypothetical protein
MKGKIGNGVATTGLKTVGSHESSTQEYVVDMNGLG